ncbi:MAG: zinc ribbon domain-containing protein, partial [Leptospiraceae bacterium]|nr:zinc ribbon domain-containing protein [Leptospiraceae bacterium]
NSYAKLEPDWECSSCGGDNPAGNKFCDNCGSPKESDDAVRVKKDYKLSEVPKSSEDFQKKDTKPQEKYETKKSSFSKWIISSILFLAGIIWFFFFSTTDIELKADSFSWTRSIEIEQYKWVQDSSWDSTPTGARGIRSSREIHHHDKVLDHYEDRTRNKTRQISCGTETYVCGKTDNGNGTFSDKYCDKTKYCSESYTENYREAIYRDEPVYKTKFRYEIQKWIHERDVNSRGNDNVEKPYWPKTYIGEGRYVSLQEREGKRVDEYIIILKYIWKKKEEVYKKSIPERKWSSFKKGDVFKAEINRVGSIKNIQPSLE